MPSSFPSSLLMEFSATTAITLRPEAMSTQHSHSMTMLLTGSVVQDITCMNGICTSYPLIAKVAHEQYTTVNLLQTVHFSFFTTFTLPSTVLSKSSQVTVLNSRLKSCLKVEWVIFHFNTAEVLLPFLFHNKHCKPQSKYS